MRADDDGVCALRAPRAGADWRAVEPIWGKGALGLIGAGAAFLDLVASWFCVGPFTCMPGSSLLSSRLSCGMLMLAVSS